MSFEEEIKTFLQKEGADISGICAAKPFKESEVILSGAESVIVVAVRHSRAALSSKNLRVKQYDTLIAYREIDRITRALFRFLGRCCC
ncbi:hypothetical protein [Candidatus Alkanophaga liquidiphilum]|nr:hypothetical protein [Candidatus Alkanophaga liquidiphilum]